MAISISVPKVNDVISNINSAAASATAAVSSATSIISVQVPALGDVMNNINAAAGAASGALSSALGGPEDAATNAMKENAAAIEAALPSFDSMIASVKDGSLFKSVEDTLTKVSSAITLPDVPELPVVDISSILSIVDASTKSFSVDVSVAKAGIAQAVKDAQARGEQATQAEIDAAMGPLAVMKNLKSELEKAIESATALAVSISSLRLDVPENLALAVSSINSFSASLTSSFESIASIGTASKGETILNLKANILLSQLSSPQPPPIAATILDVIDSEKVSILNIIKAQETPVVTPASLVPAVDLIRSQL